MTSGSLGSVFWLLGALSIAVTILTNYVRHRPSFKHLRDASANKHMGGIYRLTILWGVSVALVLRANIIEILKNPEGPALFFSWTNVEFTEPLYFSIPEEVFGIVITGLVLAFLTKFWNDVFDIIYEVKRWLRGHASLKENAAKRFDGKD